MSGERGGAIAGKTVGDYMRGLGVRARHLRPYTATADAPDPSSELKNILEERFSPQEPDAVWRSDIAYIWTLEGFVCLAGIMDPYPRKIIGWVFSDALGAKGVVAAMEKAKAARDKGKPRILHADRGLQHARGDYARATEGIQRSDSRRAYPWDNACIESPPMH